MYINFKLLQSKGLTINDFIVLQMCRQQRTEDLSAVLAETVGDEEVMLSYEDDGLVKQVKGKKKDSFYSKFRTTDKGNTLLDDLESFSTSEDDIVFYNWVADIYKDKGKTMGNASKAKTWIASFRILTGIEKNSLAFLLKEFMRDEECQAYSQRVDYIFFKPPNVFTTKFSLGESKLYNYYLKRKEFFDTEFKKFETKNN